jgi:hypothetical protein
MVFFIAVFFIPWGRPFFFSKKRVSLSEYNLLYFVNYGYVKHFCADEEVKSAFGRLHRSFSRKKISSYRLLKPLLPCGRTIPSWTTTSWPTSETSRISSSPSRSPWRSALARPSGALERVSIARCSRFARTSSPGHTSTGAAMSGPG